MCHVMVRFNPGFIDAKKATQKDGLMKFVSRNYSSHIRPMLLPTTACLKKVYFIQQAVFFAEYGGYGARGAGWEVNK